MEWLTVLNLTKKEQVAVSAAAKTRTDLKQKSSPDKSDELEYDGLIISKLDSDLSASPSWRDGIGTFL